MIERLLNGRGPMVLFAAIAIALVGIWLFMSTNTNSDEPTSEPTPTAAPVTPTGPDTPIVVDPTPTADPTASAAVSTVEFPISAKELDAAAAVAEKWGKTAFSYTWQTDPDEWRDAVAALSYNGNVDALLSDTAGPLGLDRQEAEAEQLTVEGRSTVTRTVLVSTNSVMFMTESSAIATRNGESTQSRTIVQQMTVERQDGGWKVSAVVADASGAGTTE